MHEGIQHQSNLYQTKAIASNPAVVTNIQSLLKTTINLQQFNKELRDFIKSELNSKESRTFTSSEIKLIQELTDEKYKSWEWNFGYSPDFQLNRTLYFHNKKVDFQLFIHRGNIQKISCSKKNELSDSLCTNLIGVRHNFEDIQQTLYGIKDLKTASKNRLSSIAKELL